MKLFSLLNCSGENWFGKKRKSSIKDSDLILDCYNGNGITVEKIEIENSNIRLVKTISYNKCVIISSKQSLNEIVNHCKELVLKKIKEVDICFENEQVKKITFEDCSKIQCHGDLKGKEVKLIRCSDMKLNDTSNSIQIESCRNIEVDIQTIQTALPLLVPLFKQPQNTRENKD